MGLATQQEYDAALVQDLLDRMAAGKADFTLTFRRLSDAAEDAARDRDVRHLFIDPTAYDSWARRWRSRLADETRGVTERGAAMRAVNPAYIPRNYRVEEVIRAAVADNDFEPFERFGQILATPTTLGWSSPLMPSRPRSTRVPTGRSAAPETTRCPFVGRSVCPLGCHDGLAASGLLIDAISIASRQA